MRTTRVVLQVAIGQLLSIPLGLFALELLQPGSMSELLEVLRHLDW